MPFSKQVRTRRNTILVLLAIIGLVASTTFISSSVTASAVVYAETADYYELKLGDKTWATVKTQAEAQSIIDGVKKHYAAEGYDVLYATCDPEMTIEKKTYQVATEKAPVFDTDTKTIADKIVAGETTTDVYTVQDGDTMWDIAVANSTTVDDIIDDNPDFDPEVLMPGDEINFRTTSHYVNVTVGQEIPSRQETAYDTVYEDTDELYADEEEVKQEGVLGLRNVVEHIVTVNGEVTESTEISSEVVSEPTTEIILRGTKEREEPVQEDALEAAREETAYESNTSSSSSSSYTAPAAPAYQGDGQSIASFALSCVGIPYVWGGTNLSSGVDCSGFVYAVYRACGYGVSRFPDANGYVVPNDAKQPGDILRYPGHYAIYVGGGMEVEALNAGTGVVTMPVGVVNGGAYYTVRVVG